ncbi:MAG: iron chelate uptake ABC transporter family permease subunit, partial [Methanomassiliicoccaceae archaeon]|nr:iron chelate uptake ABC transporter family permease subunit [Methanomassiliicoccaceae archaeon]
PPPENVLFDMGNGSTVWAVSAGTGTIGDVLEGTAAAEGIEFDISAETNIGGTGTGSFILPGMTNVTVTSKWFVYEWTAGEWVLSDKSHPYSSSVIIAAAFFPEDKVVDGVGNPLPDHMTPLETPDFRYSWTMIRGNAEQTGEQNYVPSSASEASVEWTDARGGTSGVYGAVLAVQGYVFVKYGSGRNIDPAVRCYTLAGQLQWEFRYPGIQDYETATPLIVGDHIYVQSGAGLIFKFPWKEGPHEVNEARDYKRVTSFDGTEWKDIDFEDDIFLDSFIIPYDTGAEMTGYRYSTGPGAMVFDSGCIYLLSSNGMAYCFDMDLSLVWSQQMGGRSYYFSPTVFDGYVAAGALNGGLYVFDKKSGNILGEDIVYQREISVGGVPRAYGSVGAPAVIKDDLGKYTLMFSISDGRGMDSVVGGIGIYEFDPDAVTDKLTRIEVIRGEFGLVSNYVQRVVTDDFKGIYFTASRGFYRIDTEGEWKMLNNSMYAVKGPPALVNGSSIYVVSYEPDRPIYEFGLDGKIISMYYPRTTVSNYNMSPVVMVDGMIFYGNDAGLIALSGTFPAYVEPVPSEGQWWFPILILLIVIIAAIAAIYAIMRLKGIERPFAYLRGKMSHYVGGDDLRHNTKNKHRLLVMTVSGAVITFIMFIVCLCVDFNSVMSVGDMFSSLFSAISKGGSALNYNELMVYESRLPRTLMALLVGIGLSIAGCMYQAIIRNPLVDPYIMGVSAGAGTAAIAVIGFNFTLFGLFSPHSIYLTAVCAIVGGIAAFFATMLIAEKAGGSSLNYVLAGIVIGLALSSIQTLMLSMAGHQVANALQWLFGSFSNVSWSHITLVAFPLIALSLVPLLWAKEFNLVLLGEDQARQMGLNVKKFSRSMLVIASVLTALCVAFVGIIGFVGLVIPHLCRMILGGDHRLVLPASIAVGGALMMFADLIARIAYYGQELPVGAITTMIGVPVFAYLLIRRGRMYDG